MSGERGRRERARRAAHSGAFAGSCGAVRAHAYTVTGPRTNCTLCALRTNSTIRESRHHNRPRFVLLTRPPARQTHGVTADARITVAGLGSYMTLEGCTKGPVRGPHTRSCAATSSPRHSGVNTTMGTRRPARSRICKRNVGSSGLHACLGQGGDRQSRVLCTASRGDSPTPALHVRRSAHPRQRRKHLRSGQRQGLAARSPRSLLVCNLPPQTS